MSQIYEITERQQVALQNRRKDLLKFLETLDYSELLELEEKYVKRTNWEIIDRIVTSNSSDIAKMHAGEGLDQPQLDEDEK